MPQFPVERFAVGQRVCAHLLWPTSTPKQRHLDPAGHPSWGKPIREGRQCVGEWPEGLIFGLGKCYGQCLLRGRCSLSRWAVMGQVLWWGRSHPSAGACRWANTKSDRRSCGMQLPPLWSILKCEQMGQSVSCPFLGTTDMGLEHPDSCFPVIQRTFLRWMGGSSPSEKKSSLLPKMYYSGCLWAKQWGPCPLGSLATGPPLSCLLCLYSEKKEVQEAKSQAPPERGAEQANKKLISDGPGWEEDKKPSSQTASVLLVDCPVCHHPLLASGPQNQLWIV